MGKLFRPWLTETGREKWERYQDGYFRPVFSSLKHTPQPLSGWWQGPQRQVPGRIRGQEYRKGVEKGQARNGGLVLLVAKAFVSRVLETPHLDGRNITHLL